MQTEEITIRVDPKAAQMYRAASETERRTLDVVLSARLLRAFEPTRSFEEISAEASRQAQENGLTPEILESILNER